MAGFRKKKILVALAVPALLLAAVAVAVPRLVSGDAFREQALQQARKATGADIDLGEARLAVLPRLGLTLRAGRIEGTGAGLRAARGDDFGIESYLVEVQAVQVRLAWLPLLQRRIEVREVVVQGPRLRLVRDGQETVAEDFRLQVRDLSLPADAGAAPAAGAPPGELIPEDLRGTARIEVGTLHRQGAAYEAVQADAELDGRVIEVPAFTARLAGGTVGGSATIDYARDPWGELVFAYEAAGVPAAALLAPWVPDLAGRLEGPLNTAGSGSCRLQDQAAILASLDLTGAAEAGEGVLHAADWLRDVSPYLGERQDLKDVRFVGLTHAYRVEKGRYLVQDLVIDGRDTAWRGSGWVGLDGTLELALQVKLPAGFTPNLGQWTFLAETLRDQEGRVQLDLLLSGRSERPNVGLDLSRLKSGAADQGAEAVRKGVGSLLDKWKSK